MFQGQSDFLKGAPAALKQKAAGQGVRSSHRGLRARRCPVGLIHE